MSKSKMARLWFRKDGFGVGLKRCDMAAYYPVHTCPVEELGEHDGSPAGIASRLVTITRGLEFHRAWRRRVDTGDLLQIDGRYYAYGDARQAGPEAEPLPDWTDLTIELVPAPDGAERI
jgi:hypothetical protein